MAKIVTNGSNISSRNFNLGFSYIKLENLSPVMIKIPAALNLKSSLTVRSSTGGDLFSRPVTLGGQERRIHTQAAVASDAMMSISSIRKSLRWWEKGIQSNMKKITGAEDLVESLLKAGDKLIVVDFFSPGCGGCKALHPKICQLAETNPDVQFLQVNYEEHKSMCYSLNVHVLPFFRFYRGAEGRLCSFSCTNATIKKFKDALAKHKPERCSLGPPKGFEEKELVALGANSDLSFTYAPKPEHPRKEATPTPSFSLPLPRPLMLTSKTKDNSRDRTLVSSGR